MNKELCSEHLFCILNEDIQCLDLLIKRLSLILTCEGRGGEEIPNSFFLENVLIFLENH